MNSKFRRRSLNLATAALCGLGLQACSIANTEFARSLIGSPFGAQQQDFLASGTIIISHSVPDRETSQPETALAPLIGYFPPAASYLPADNETWLEIDRNSKKVNVYKGKSLIKQIAAEGQVSIDVGEYYLQRKQKQPLWYASDEYFQKRQLSTPTAGDRLRYRKGALGKYALYPTTTFPIHCGPVWSDDVGGLRISSNDLSSIYYMLPVGAPIVVK